MADKEFSAAALFDEEEPEQYNSEKVKSTEPSVKAEAEDKKDGISDKREEKPTQDDKNGDEAVEALPEDDMSDLYELFRREREHINDSPSIKDRLTDAARRTVAVAKKAVQVKKEKPAAQKPAEAVEINKPDEALSPVTKENTAACEAAKSDAGGNIAVNPTFADSVPKKYKKIIAVVATVLVFAVFFGFLIKQYSYAYLSHDDYGYATLSYVYWEDGMWGQNFSLSQLTHYLVEHYNRWGGRILSFGQNILLFKAGTSVIQSFNAVVLGGIYLLAFLFAQNSEKTKWMPLAAVFTCAVFGFTGESIATSGLYWYSASILYMVPVIYIFLGAWLMYITMLDEVEHTVSVSKLMMLPLACVLMFFGGFSLEHNGIFAVVTAGTMCVYTSFKKRNPVNLIYGILPFLSSVAGCHIMLMAVGNNSRKSSYADYYALPFAKQILTSGKTIAQTLFSSGNMVFVLLLAAVTVCIAAFLNKKKKPFFTVLFVADIITASASAAVAYGNIKTDKTAILMWIYLVLMAVTVSIWLFSSGKKQDMLIWAIFLGGLASQGACLISPIFPARCLVPFVLTFALVASRAFNEVLCAFEELPGEARLRKACAALIPVVVISAFGAGKIYNGFKENDAVQSYNERMLKVVSYEYTELNKSADTITLMKLKNDAYAGSTQPYGRDLIKDWMKIYYKLPANLQYDSFVYEEYDEERLAELEEQLAEKENAYFSVRDE